MHILCLPGLSQCTTMQVNTKIQHVVMTKEKSIRVITQLPNSEQSYKGKVKIHKYINRQNQSTTENCEHRNDPDLVQAFLKMVG